MLCRALGMTSTQASIRGWLSSHGDKRIWARGAGLRVMRSLRLLAAVSLLLFAGVAEAVETVSSRTLASGFGFEIQRLAGDVPITVTLCYKSGSAPRHSVVLMLGSLDDKVPPAWSVDLLPEGFMLAAFAAAHAPDPDPARRPVWLYFDERFAHGYVQGAHYAIADAARVIDYLTSRTDVNPEKIGWLGSSSTGIPGLAVATREPRLTAVVAFVSTGAYRQWFTSWYTNALWRSPTFQLWPETEALLDVDPILHADKLFPKAILMVSGGDDKVVDPATARAFVNVARPYYQSDPARLRLVVYEGFAHNLPRDIVKLYAEHWLRLYLHPTRPAPKAEAEAPWGKAGSSTGAKVDDSVKRTQINAADHRQVIQGAK